MKPTPAQQHLLRILASFDCRVVWQRPSDNADGKVPELPLGARFPESTWWDVKVERGMRSWLQPTIRLPVLRVLRERGWIQLDPRPAGANPHGAGEWDITPAGRRAWDRVRLPIWPGLTASHVAAPSRIH